MPIKYIPYVPNTIEGQAILNNITRTRRVLRYRDNERVYEHIRRGLPLYEVETIERVGSSSSNLLIRGECLSACAYLKEKDIAVDLVYIDPPFASGADYAKKVYLRRNPRKARKVVEHDKRIKATLQSGEEIDLEELRAFEEKMYGDIWNKEDYLNWMYENLTAIKSVMSELGSIYVHLDWHIGHYVKILMDEIFGDDNFQNEVIWAYSGRGISKTSWNRKHDAIYFYTKSADGYYFDCDAVREEYSEEAKKKFKYWDEDKQDYYQIRGKNIQGSPVQSADGLLPEDEVTYAGLTYRQYMGSGMLPKDWWEIPLINKAANERADYATQKPEALLERIITASSKEGMVVADFFGGSGVAAKVSHKLKRNFIHVDVGMNSLLTTRDRLKIEGASFNVLDINDGVSLFRNPAQTMDKLKKLIPGLKNEDSLDDFWEGAINDSKLGTVPVYIPNLLDHTTKVLDIPLMNRVLNEALPDLPDGVKQVVVYYVDIEDRKVVDGFINEYNPTNIKVELRDLKEVLDEVVLNDVTKYELRKIKHGYEVEITRFISDRLQQKIDEYNQKKGLSDART
ncbi:MAG: site-specific DNA-methyltransferase, partial [Acidobacteriota bacterium]|nr:site-specific DNA-methyltransferase [Acidobacteriota bacterium]